MTHHDKEIAIIDLLESARSDWQPWCESLGFDVRRITRRLAVCGEADRGYNLTDENLSAELDILGGLRYYRPMVVQSHMDGSHLATRSGRRCASQIMRCPWNSSEMTFRWPKPNKER